MTDQEILQKLTEIAKHYIDDDWPLYDLQCDIEEILNECRNRTSIFTSKHGEE